MNLVERRACVLFLYDIGCQPVDTLVEWVEVEKGNQLSGTFADG
jgi:hypothetical protein